MTPASPSRRRRGGLRGAASSRAGRSGGPDAAIGRGWTRVMRGLAVAAIATGFATVAPAEAEAPPPKLSAEQIVAKNVAARGGLAAWKGVQTMVWIGHIESAHAPVPSVLFVLQQQRPNRTRFEINALGQKTVRGFDGT